MFLPISVREEEKDREGNINWLPPIHTQQRSNPIPSGAWLDVQPAEPPAMVPHLIFNSDLRGHWY